MSNEVGLAFAVKTALLFASKARKGDPPAAARFDGVHVHAEPGERPYVEATERHIIGRVHSTIQWTDGVVDRVWSRAHALHIVETGQGIDAPSDMGYEFNWLALTGLIDRAVAKEADPGASLVLGADMLARLGRLKSPYGSHPPALVRLHGTGWGAPIGLSSEDWLTGAVMGIRSDE